MKKTINLEILKKNRKYFAAKLDGKYKCKLHIDSASENLELGLHTLLVLDESIVTKYGTDLIFRLAASADTQKTAGICTIQHDRYNSILVDKCRNLGGKWDHDAKAWVFSDLMSSEVEDLDALFNSDEVAIEITAKTDLSAWHDSVTFAGYSIAKASGRDSGAVLCEGVSKVSGTVTSGGSVKNWSTEVEEGAIFRLLVPRDVLQLSDEGDWDITILGD
jgi:hypothetical protein